MSVSGTNGVNHATQFTSPITDVREAGGPGAEEVMPGTHGAIKRSEKWFRRFASVAVAVEPGAAVCLLAGTSRMSPTHFAAVNVAGTTARVLAIRWAGHAGAGYVARAMPFIARFRAPLTIATAAAAAATALPLVMALIHGARGRGVTAAVVAAAADACGGADGGKGLGRGDAKNRRTE